MAHRASQSTSGRRAELSSVLHGGVACDVGMAGGVSGGVEGVEGDSARRRKVVRCVARVRAYNRWRRCSQPCGDSSRRSASACARRGVGYAVGKKGI